MKSNTSVITVERQVTHISLEPREKESICRLLNKVAKRQSFLIGISDSDFEVMNQLRTACGLNIVKHPVLTLKKQ